jgi:hypothetical protein
MFGPDSPETDTLYKKINDEYDPSAPIKSKESAESFRQLLATDIKFMISSDHEWEFSDDDEPAPVATVLHPAAPNDDAGGPNAADVPAPPAAVDLRDITKCDVWDFASIPLSAEDFDENNITALTMWRSSSSSRRTSWSVSTWTSLAFCMLDFKNTLCMMSMLQNQCRCVTPSIRRGFRILACGGGVESGDL